MKVNRALVRVGRGELEVRVVMRTPPDAAGCGYEYTETVLLFSEWRTGCRRRRREKFAALVSGIERAVREQVGALSGRLVAESLRRVRP